MADPNSDLGPDTSDKPEPEDQSGNQPGSSQVVCLDTAEVVAAGGSVAATVHHPLPDGHSMFRMVGQVASEWSLLEHKLDTIIWKLVDETGAKNRRLACITATFAGQYTRVKAIKSLCSDREIPQEIIKLLTRMSNDLNSAYDARNRVVHDAWYLSETTEAVEQFRSMPQGDLFFGFRTVDEDEVKETISSIKLLRAEIDRFDVALSRELTSSP
jgi:hypothetical protein